MSKLLDQHILVLKSQTDEAVKNLHDLASATSSEEMIKLVSDLRNRINEPFMFVIVGEVKAGKSSFINALLESEKEICAVGPQPVTDTIQQILFGEEEEILIINPYLKKIFRDIPILKDIAIVDTPGTNTIIEQHQEITERFIPSSDLVVFVFEAKNPYRQSAWQFFDYIQKDWQKKVIFVLQQKDLMSMDDLAVNVQGVRDQAIKKGVKTPSVFATSAKLEQEGELENSGFAEIRAYIQENITGGKAPVLKLENSLLTCRKIGTQVAEGVQTRLQQWEADVHFRKDVQETLDAQEKRSLQQVKGLVRSLLTTYDHITLGIEKELKEGLSFFTLVKRSFQSLFRKKFSAKEWLEGLAAELDEKLHRELNQSLTIGISDLAESIQQMARIIDLKIKDNKTILKSNHEIFSDIAERRNQTIEELQQSFDHFLSRTENFTARDLFPDRQTLSPNIAAGSGIAVIGVILATVTNGMIFDITGGVLTTIGLLFAGISSGSKRRKIVRGFHAEIDKGRLRMEEEVQKKLEAYVEHIKKKIVTNFQDFDLLLEEEEKNLEKLKVKLEEVQSSIEGLLEKVQEELTV
jgi:GTPase SAR1 family protein